MLHVMNSFFDQSFIDFVEDVASNEELRTAKVGGLFEGDSTKINDMRRSSVKMISHPVLRDALYNVIAEVNAKEYGFDIYNHAHIQYTIYEGTNRGHYDWHRDDGIIGKGLSRRKISVSVQLSDPWEYEGGDFEIEGVDIAGDIKQKGTVLIFPSYEAHRVTPVTKGTRKSLVAWFFGPLWR